MSFWTPESIRAAVGGTYIARAQAVSLAGGVSIDTRTLKPGQIFAAFKGEHANGHTYLHEARQAGSTLALVERGRDLPEPAPEGMTLIEVDSTRAALGKLARAYRRTLTSTRVVAVTGSNGKTTTVRLIDQVLGSQLRGSASIKSFNNDIGLPLTILAAKPTDQYVVCEAGMSSPGEIAYLAQIASPDIAVITSIGRAHLEKLGSQQAIAREKASLLQGLSHGGLGVVPAGAPDLEGFLRADVSYVRFGVEEDADLRVFEIETHPRGVRFATNGGQRYELPLLGAHNALNAAAAIAVARRLGLSETQIAEALRSARGAEMRLDRRTIAGIDVINDAYNANPTSVRAALETLAQVEWAGRKIIVLGEMRELGDASPDAHRAMKDLAASLASWRSYFVGESYRSDRNWFATSADAGTAIAQQLEPGDLVLIKGSRGTRMEKIEQAIEARFNT